MTSGADDGLFPRLEDMAVVVMCGGRGKRIREVTGDEIPKPLLTVGGRTLLEHTLATLRNNGLRRVLLAVSHHAEQIRAHVGDGARYGLRVAFAETVPGRGVLRDLLSAAREFGLLDATFLMTGADEICDGLDLEPVYRLHRERSALITVMLAAGVPDAERHVEAEIEPGGLVTRLLRERSAISHTVVSHSFVHPSILAQAAGQNGQLDDSTLLRSLLPAMVQERRLYGLICPLRRYLHVGDAGSYLRAVQVLGSGSPAAAGAAPRGQEVAP